MIQEEARQRVEFEILPWGMVLSASNITVENFMEFKGTMLEWIEDTEKCFQKYMSSPGEDKK